MLNHTIPVHTLTYAYVTPRQQAGVGGRRYVSFCYFVFAFFGPQQETAQADMGEPLSINFSLFAHVPQVSRPNIFI